MFQDDSDESSTYSVDNRDFLKVPGLPRIEENIHSQHIPEAPRSEGDRASQLVPELPRMEGDITS